MWIINNDSLNNINSLSNINSDLMSSMIINNNLQLSECDVQSLCDYLASPNGPIAIYDNAPGCNGPEEIQQACLISVDNNSK
jgi:hypothetical protein